MALGTTCTVAKLDYYKLPQVEPGTEMKYFDYQPCWLIHQIVLPLYFINNTVTGRQRKKAYAHN